MGEKWTKNEERKLKSLAESGLSMLDIARELNRVRKSVEHKARRMGIRLDTQRAIEGQAFYYIKQGVELLTEPKLRIEREKIHQHFSGLNKKLKILTGFDMHMPFQRNDLIKELIKEGGDILALSEIFDLYAASRFRKDKFIPLRDEFLVGVQKLTELAKHFKYMVMGSCNHHARLLALIMDKLKDFPEVVELIGKGDVLNIRKRLPGINLLTTDSWWFKIGDIIFAHPDWFSNVNLRTVQSSYEYFAMEGEDYNVIVNAHTHHSGYTPYRNKILIESGCLSYRMDYLREGKKRIETHQGFWSLILDKQGKFVFNESRPFLYPTK